MLDLLITTVFEPKADKNGNNYVRIVTEEYIDDDGVLNPSQSKLIYNEKLFDKVKVGMKIRL